MSDVDSEFLSQINIRFLSTPPDGINEVLMLSNPFPKLSFLQNTEHQIVVYGVATLSTYQSLLRNLTYTHNLSLGDPTEGARNVEIYVIDDLNSTSIPDLVTIAFISVNNAPVVDLNGLQPGRDYSVVYRESSGNLSILPVNVSIVDVDNSELTEVIITLTNPQNESEFLSLSNTSSLEINQSPNRVVISSINYSPIELFVKILQTLTYSNFEDEPNNTTRIISVIASDGLLTSEIVYIEINVLLVNDAPFLDLDSFSSSSESVTTFIENQPAVYISPRAIISDPDSRYISQLRIQFSDINDLSLISIDNSSLNCNVTLFTCSVHFLPFTTLSTVSLFISTLTFSDPASEPHAMPRVFFFSVFDGLAWSSTSRAQVFIQPVNDNIPLFTNTPYVSTIEENIINFLVFMATSSDVDSQNSVFIPYYSIQDCENCPFIINSSSGQVYTSPVNIIDRESNSLYMLTLQVTDGTFSSTTFLSISIKDQNDNCPSFSPDDYTYIIPLQTPSGTSLLTVLATDPDLSPNGTNSILFEILRATDITTFDIDPNTGVLYLTVDEVSLNPNITHKLTIGASGPSCSVIDSKNNASLTINLIQNTMPPKFLQDSLFCIFSEGIITGNCIAVASDDDIGVYGSFIYTIVDPSNTFSITDTSGIITVRNGAILDFEVTKSYNLTVVATDNGRPSMSSTAQLRIQVTDINDNIPIFSQPAYSSIVCENTPINTTILQVEASDRDSGSFGEIEYYITPTYVPFLIDPINGRISINGVLDFEKLDAYSFNVSAVDGGRNRSMVPVSIRILNSNDNAPSFLSPFYQVLLPENATIGTPLPLPSILAIDADLCEVDQCIEGETNRTDLLTACLGSIKSNQRVTFSILPSPDSDFFSINSDTGLITLNMMINFENVSLHTITIQASDQIFNTSTVVMIYVNDINDNAPTFLQLKYSANIREGTNINTSVLQVMARDLDSGNNSDFTFILQGAGNYFVIGDDGIIYTNSDIDYEQTNEFVFKVTAIDMGIPHMIGTAEVNITILDINDNAPVFSNSMYTSSILENADRGSVVIIVDAFDLDSGTNAKLNFSIQGNTPFLINSTTGLIFLEFNIDYETTQEYSFLVTVTDQGGTSMSDTAQVNVSILDVNDNPVSFNQNVFNVTLDENLHPSNLLQLFATDVDSAQITNIFFSLSTPLSSIPFIVTSVGTIMNTQPIDFEINKFFSFQVIVYDDGAFHGSFDTATINVHIRDLNDNSPIFPQASYFTEIKEHSGFGTSVITVSATDLDSGVNGEIEYTISKVSPLVNQTAFSIDPNLGLITVKIGIVLDRELYTTITLQVTAFNPNLPYQYPGNSTVSVIISLIDINDNLPEFLNTSYIFTISEDFGTIVKNDSLKLVTPRLVGKVEAHDQDTGNNSLLNYFLILTESSFVFRINSTTGEIYTTSSLDREETDVYTLYITVTDHGNPTLMNMVEATIVITDVNDNIPVLSDDIISLSLSEMTPIGTLVYTFTAIDLDIGENSRITYTIISNYSSPIPFTVYINQGALYVSSDIDRESTASYFFFIRVSDNGSPSLNSTSSLLVELLDENDNAPLIHSNSSNIVRILESAPIGAFVSAVYVTDNDLPPNTDYSLSLSSAVSTFNISEDGVISTRLPLDFEFSTHYNITVLARNIQPPYFTTTFSILVNIINENDENPSIQIETTNSMFNYFEGHFNLLVNPFIKIQDNDVPPFNQITSANISLLVLDISYNQEFITNMDDLPYPCLNEDKFLKARGCGVDNIAIITSQGNGLILFNNASLTGYSLSLESVSSQYGEYKDSVPLATQDSGLTISLWIWYEAITNDVSSTILSKAAPNSDSTKILLAVTCVNRNFHFLFNSINGPEEIILDDICALLTNSWHHLAIVIQFDSSTWLFSLYIDGDLVVTLPISEFRDESGRLFLGATPTLQNFNELQNYFNGFMHFLFFSSRVSSSTIYCSIGCGEALWINDDNTNLSLSFSYTSGILSISGTSSESVYEDLMNSLYYINTEDEPQFMEQGIVYQISDGVSSSAPEQVGITLVVINDYSPELNLGDSDGNFRTLFLEESSPVSLVDSANFLLTDRDTVAFDYVVIVTIIDHKQSQSEEVLRVSNTYSHISVTYENFELSIIGYGSISEFSLILSTITYQNLADELIGDSRTVNFTVNDNSERFAPTRFCFISLIPVNDLPVITLDTTQIYYSEDDPAIVLSEQLTITDNDHDTLSEARVELLGRLDGENERLTIPGETILIPKFSSTTGILSVSGQEPLSVYVNLLSQIAYEHHGANSTNGIREVKFFVSDGLDYSIPASVFIFFNTTNDPPIVDLNGDSPGLHFETSFTEDSGVSVLAVSPNLIITDIDSSMLSWARLILKDPIDSTEYISVSTENSQLIHSYNNTLGILTISPSNQLQAPISDFISVLRTLIYNNPSEEPTPLLRTICVTVSDGQSESRVSNSSITITPVNDVPYIDLDITTSGNDYEASYTEGGPPVCITSRNVSVIDNDNTNFVSLFIRILSNVTLYPGEELLISTMPNLTIPIPVYISTDNAVEYCIPLHRRFDAKLVLLSLKYLNQLPEPRSTHRILEFHVFDGKSFSPSVYTRLQIIHVNAQSPTFLQPSYQFNIFENSIVPTLIGSVTAQDQDSGVDGQVYYSLTSSGESSLNGFNIIRDSGIIYSDISFDREDTDLYMFTVYAFDSGEPQRSSKVNVTIVVLDENEFPPTVQPNDSLTYFVLEEQMYPVSIGVIVATDEDVGENADIRFLIVGGDGLNLFYISDNGVIITNFTFDRERKDNYELIISISDRGIPSLSSQITVSIKVIDVNDNGPIFLKNASANIPENLPNSYVLTLKATDRDTAVNSVVFYQLVDGNQFFIDNKTGDIYTGPKGLDRELVGVYNLLGLAIDFGGFNGTQGFTGFVTIMIFVTDKNDNHPLFEQNSYSGFVSENSLLNFITSVKATDIDAGVNKIVRYTIATPDVPFVINEVSGVLSVSGIIDYESISQYDLEVVAYDLGDPSLNSSVVVSIYVNDTNDNIPKFTESEYSADLLENTISNNIVTVRANDRDSTMNADLTYSLLNYQSLFSIHPLLGNISNNNPLDYEFVCLYELLVSVRDNGLPILSSSVSVFISISNLEDISPRFTKSSFSTSVLENQFMSFLLTLTANDFDGLCPNKSRIEQSYLIYSIISSTGPFLLSLSGDLTAASLDRELTELHYLNVSVSDPAGLTDFASVTVTVLDVNDNSPSFPNNVNIFQFSLSESAPKGFLIATIPVSDADDIDEGKLVFSVKSPYSSNFTINSTGHIIVEFLDFESGEISISLFQVQDSLNNTITGVVIIITQDADDNAPELFGIDSSLDFTEGSEPLSIFSTLLIVDRDLNFQYVSSVQLMLSSPEPSNYSLSDSCSCEDVLCDFICLEYLFVNQSSLSPNITILHQFGSKYITISGTESIGYYINLLRSVNYVNQIQNPLPSPRTIFLTVTDIGGHSVQSSIFLELVVLNQFPPILDLDGFDTVSIIFETTFIENGDPISIVGSDISFMDPDMGTPILSRLTITINNPIDSTEEYLFLSPIVLPSSLRLISSNTSMMLYGTGSHSVYISFLKAVRYLNVATEPNLHTRIITFEFEEGHLTGTNVTTLILFNGTNDFPPNISPGNFSTRFVEGSTQIAIVTSNLQIIDRDSIPVSNVELLVKIVNVFDTEGDLIEIIPGFSFPVGIEMVVVSDVKLKFSGNASLDLYERILLGLRYSYRFSEFVNNATRLVCFSISDDPTMFFTATAEIELVSVNDQHPSIQPLFSVELEENENIGSMLLRIPFNDDDTHSVSTPNFSLQDSFNNTFYFNNNGMLFLNSKLDFETISFYTLEVSVSDTSIAVNVSVSTAQILITLLDVNDNPPVFQPNTYNITIEESQPVGSVILTLQASDIDTGVNAELIFQLLNGVTDFYLNSTTGNLSVGVQLNFNAQQVYTLTAYVTNPNSSFFNFALIIIQVLDVNNNPPILSISPLYTTFFDGQNTHNFQIFDFIITDIDPNPNLDAANISIQSASDVFDYISLDSSLTDLSVSGSSTKMIQIFGTAPIYIYLSLFSNIVYTDPASEPLNTNRSVSIIVEDTTGPFVSNTVTLTFIPQYMNDNVPILNISGTSLPFQTNFIGK